MDSTAAAPMEREEGKADGSRVAALDLVVVCWYGCTILYGMILLHGCTLQYDTFAYGENKSKILWRED